MSERVTLVVDEVTPALNRLLTGFPIQRLLDSSAALGESQIRERIATDKRAPSGEKWSPWSDDYARTRGPQHSLGVASGAMLDSIGWNDAGRNARRVGSPQNYAEFFEAERPFVGISDDNANALADLGERILRSELEVIWQ